MVCLSPVTGGSIAGYSGETLDCLINLLASLLVGGINFVTRSVCIGFCFGCTYVSTDVLFSETV